MPRPAGAVEPQARPHAAVTVLGAAAQEGLGLDFELQVTCAGHNPPGIPPANAGGHPVVLEQNFRRLPGLRAVNNYNMRKSK